jgi:hypothetical protein
MELMTKVCALECTLSDMVEPAVVDTPSTRKAIKYSGKAERNAASDPDGTIRLL